MNGYKNTEEYVARGGRGLYKLTDDFETEAYSGKFVRDINMTPDDKRLPDLAICRVFSSRRDAEILLAALQATAISR